MRRNFFIRTEQRSSPNLLPFTQKRADILKPFFVEARASHLHARIRIDQKYCRHCSQSVGVGRRIAFLIQNHWKCHAIFAGELLRSFRVVLRYSEERNATSSIALEEPLNKRKCKLAHRTRNFEECRYHRALFHQRPKGVVLAVEIFQRKSRSSSS